MAYYIPILIFEILIFLAVVWLFILGFIYVVRSGHSDPKNETFWWFKNPTYILIHKNKPKKIRDLKDVYKLENAPTYIQLKDRLYFFKKGVLYIFLSVILALILSLLIYAVDKSL